VLELVGFIAAPDMDSKKRIFKPTIPPISMPLNPFTPIIYTTSNVTTINKDEATTSMLKIITAGKL
jgi:hypothetical protein